jgi:hypothetical protein
MNCDIIFDNAIGFFVIKTSGKMTGDGFVDMGKGLLGHSLWEPGKNVIFDHTELDFSEVYLAELETIRSFHKDNEKQIGPGMSAIVVKPGFSGKWYKLWNGGQKIQTGNIVMVFDDFEDAVQWIWKESTCL